MTENSVVFAYDGADIWKLLVLNLFESYIKYL